MDTPAGEAGPLNALLENHRTFLAYLTRKVGDRAVAEDLLQDAFARVVARPDQAPEGEGLVPWFYRTLRNAAVDRFRRQGAANRALEVFARELEGAGTVPEETRTAVCQCISRLAATLKPDYAEVLRAVEIDGLAVKDFAERKGLTSGNAAVRVFRARQALKQRVAESCGTCAEHGCLNCTCQAAV
jgi:RNA polymerase sigma-70 factor (ECF subfamily)